MSSPPELRSRFRATMLGLAVGDALGAPVEFLPLEQIHERYGPEGVGDLVGSGGFPAGYYTDDTQMSVATARGLIRARQHFGERFEAHISAAVYGEYLKWLGTQDDPRERRAPGHTCLSELKRGTGGTIANPINDSKGCGGVVRTAPVGLACSSERAFLIGAECAALTHGHESAYWPAGFLSELISRLIAGEELRKAVEITRETLVLHEGHEETLNRVNAALELSQRGTPETVAIEKLGRGWVGDEALAISLFCALRFPRDWSAATLAAVNHSGDSDSTGSICGGILGAYLGCGAIPPRWLECLENRVVLQTVADDLLFTFSVRT